MAIGLGAVAGATLYGLTGDSRATPLAIPIVIAVRALLAHGLGRGTRRSR